MENQEQKSNNESAQINFKLSNDERQYLENQAAKFDMTLSEYLRVKALDNDDQVFKLKTKNAQLIRENKALQVKFSRYKENEQSPDNIVLQLNTELNDFFENMFSDYGSEEISLGNKTTFFLLRALEIHHQDFSFRKRNISLQDIKDAMQTFTDFRDEQMYGSDGGYDEDDE